MSHSSSLSPSSSSSSSSPSFPFTGHASGVSSLTSQPTPAPSVNGMMRKIVVMIRMNSMRWSPMCFASSTFRQSFERG